MTVPDHAPSFSWTALVAAEEKFRSMLLQNIINILVTLENDLMADDKLSGRRKPKQSRRRRPPDRFNQLAEELQLVAFRVRY